jgi:site-specific recombinase XerD
VVDETRGPVEEANAFLSAIAVRGLSPHTIRAYAFDLVAIYRWLEVTHRQLVNINQADLLDFIAHELERKANPSSINRRLIVCRLLCDFWRPGGLSVTPGTTLPAPHYRSGGRDYRLGLHVRRKKGALILQVKVPKRLVKPLSAEEVREYLCGLTRYRDIAVVHLMLLCGLRSCEVLSLRRQDISLFERCVRVLGKGNRERVVPLAEVAASAIEQYLTYERPRGCADELFVCLQGKRLGGAMTAAGLRNIFRYRRNKLALQSANPHRFRHTFGADMARSGVGLPVIQKLMGHTNPEMTLRYINLSLADVTEAYREATAKLQERYHLG